MAEGVESEPQRRFLQALQCHVMQGYLFAPALAPEALEEWLIARESQPASVADVA